MFTGIVTDVGTVTSVEEKAAGLRRVVVASSSDPEGIALGASICHDGICLTVIEKGRVDGSPYHVVEAAAETLRLTTAGHWKAGTRVNLERSLKIGDELGGHLVTGHVDGLATITERRDFDGMMKFTFRAPRDLARFIATKGSVALDGTSLTVNLVDGDLFSVLLIPHTLAVTTWADRQAGDPVNLEVDLMARYAARLSETASTA
jgi:riboflavin synthase